MELFDRFIAKGLIERLQSVVGQDFAHITYSEAVEQLLSCGKVFEFPVQWGIDLQSEHERYLTEEVYRRPLIVTDYPAAIKPFYMRVNDDGKTVAAMDILVPGVGEIVGGSQREERLAVLERRMLEAGIDLEEYRWYLDLRRYGSVPHAGFGLGFERLVQFVTGMANIREVIPFPRTPGFAPC
jgi:asparaginyl-tRNA synthetase